VTGTVLSISSTSITVRTAARNLKTVAVVVTPSTEFVKNGAAVSAKRLEVDKEAVIYVKQNGEKLEAAAVRLGT